MAAEVDKKLTDLTEITTPARADLFHVGDVSDDTDDPAGTSKKHTFQNLSRAIVPVYNVKDYGALGDGSTNDTAAIQATIDACPDSAGGRGGSKVIFPDGEYLVTDSLVLKHGIGIEGMSYYQPYIKANMDKAIFTDSGASTAGYAHFNNILMRNLNTGTSASCLNLHTAAYFRANGTSFTSLGGKAVHLEACILNYFNECYFAGGASTQHGLYLAEGCNVSRVTNCTFQGSMGGIYAIGFDSLTLNGNHFESLKGTGSYYTARFYAITGGTVMGNYFESNDQRTLVFSHVCAAFVIGGNYALGWKSLFIDASSLTDSVILPNRLRTNATDVDASGIYLTSNGCDGTIVYPQKWTSAGTGYESFLGTGAIGIFQHTATPEGAIKAGVGSLCINTAGGAGTTLYIKESGGGTSNTGWKPMATKATGAEINTGTNDVKFTTPKAIEDSYIGLYFYNPNVIINPGFTINQRVWASDAVLADGVYGHDRWKGGASGGDYTFTQLNGPTTITIKANKSLIQVVDVKNVIGGTYTLSWTGTAQARFGIDSATPSGDYADSPVTATGQTAGTAMSVEFDAGTVGKISLTNTTVALPFQPKSYEDELRTCQRYCFVPDTSDDIFGNGWGATTTIAVIMIPLPVTMRTKIPTMSATAADFALSDLIGADIAVTTLTATTRSTAEMYQVNVTVAAGLTADKNYVLRGDGGGARLLILDAEL